MYIIAYRFEADWWKPIAMCPKREDAETILEYLQVPHELTRTTDRHSFRIVWFPKCT